MAWNWDKKFLLKLGKSLKFLWLPLSAGKMRVMSFSLCYIRQDQFN